MSAICGIVGLNGEVISNEICDAMMSALNKFQAQYSNTIHKQHVFLGCRHTSFTPESINEKLPFRDSESGLLITADAIIDNRFEILNSLDVPCNYWNQTTDSEIILLAYKKWGENCLNYLIGDYAFAIYNENNQELFCVRDPIGKRTLYYCCTAGFFAFSTTIEPLLKTLDEKIELNEEWIVRLLTFRDINHDISCEQTVYNNIMQLLPAQKMVIRREGIRKKTQYWTPLNASIVRYKTDAEYEEAFYSIFSEAVNCRLRTNKSIGVMVSGGLDSASVASVAASKLQMQNKKLYAYCSIPFDGYIDYLDKHRIANESAYVNSLTEKYSNIVVNFVKSSDKNSITDVNNLINILEQPYYIIENFFWINEIASNAVRDNCSIMLTGQSGNATISFGTMPAFLLTMFRKGKWVRLYREIEHFSKLVNVKSEYILKNFILNYLLNNFINYYRTLKYKPQRINELVLLNPYLIDKYELGKIISKVNDNSKECNSFHKSRIILSKPNLFCQTGLLDTKLSLNYGLQFRDPTSDKRIYEFCFGIPDEQFVKNGQDRSLVRRGLEGILPDKIRFNFTKRGYQSADWVQRLKPVWKNFRQEISELVKTDMMQHYIDIKTIEDFLNKIGDVPTEKNMREIRGLVICYILYKFLRNIK